MSYIDTIIPKVTLPAGVSGAWRVAHVDIPDSVAYRLRERRFEPGRYTQLFRGRTLVMSDTPAERFDHLEFVRRAKGHVLIAGLGIGMCVAACLRKPEVERVTVLELSPDVINLVAQHYACDRLEVIQTDAMLWQPPKGARYGAVWFDIWDGICSDNLPSMKTIARRYGRRADWHGCWARELCEQGY